MGIESAAQDESLLIWKTELSLYFYFFNVPSYEKADYCGSEEESRCAVSEGFSSVPGFAAGCGGSDVPVQQHPPPGPGSLRCPAGICLLDLNLSLPSRVLIPALPESWRRIPHVWPQNQTWTSGKSERRVFLLEGPFPADTQSGFTSRWEQENTAAVELWCFP